MISEFQMQEEQPEEKSRLEKLKDWISDLFNSDEPVTEEENFLINKVGFSRSQQSIGNSNLAELLQATTIFNFLPSLFPFGKAKTLDITQDGNISAEGYSTVVSYTVPEGKTFIFRKFDIPAFPRSENTDATVLYHDPEYPSCLIRIDGENIMNGEKNSTSSEIYGIIPRNFDFVGVPAVFAGQVITIEITQLAFGDDWSTLHNFAMAVSGLLVSNAEYDNLLKLIKPLF